MDKIIEVYKGTVNETLADIYRILKYDIEIGDSEIYAQFKKILNLSCENIIERWSLGKKYVRTLFAREAFPNYPDDILRLSLSIDVIVNLLDDVLDEEINKQDKILYIVELVRALALYNYQRFEKDIQNSVGNYFNKIISIAVAENFYRNLIEKEENPEKILDYSIKVYDCRSLDIDIFVEMPLLKLYAGLEKGAINKIIQIGRTFRALNLIKKDIVDIEHDRKNDIGTVVILLHDKGDSFKDYIKGLLETYSKKFDTIIVDNQLKEIRDNFYEMIKNEKQNIENMLNKS